MTVVDLGSTNGVTVSGVRLRVGEPALVPGGSVVTVGAAIITLQSPPRVHAPPQEAPSEGVADLVARVAPNDITVLILGETGVGKSVTARDIHARSGRAGKAFLKLNCAAFPEALLEAELFGYERGAFTGAVRAEPGLFRAADGGTVFLDEIGEMPLTTQAKLLAVLDTREVQRLGSLKPRNIDVRFLAATNRALPEEIAAGRFRKDLYFRIGAVTMSIPPLHARRSEILPLAEELLRQTAMRTGAPVRELTERARRALVDHRWPGNVRELRNAIERACVMAGPGPLDAEDLLLGDERSLNGVADAPRPSAAPSARPDGVLRDELLALERHRIVEALEACHGNQTRAAAMLGISRRTLIHRIEAYGLPRPRKA